MCEHPDGTRVTKPLISAPTPLLHGKDNWSIFGFCRTCVPNLALEGHRGIMVQHHSWDGALFDVMTRRITQSYEKELDSLLQGKADLSEEDLTLPFRMWTIFTKCVNHICQNSGVWGMARFVPPGVEIHKSLFKGIRSLRDSYGYIVGHIRPFLAQRLHFHDHGDNPDDVREFWIALGQRGAMADRLADLDLRWHAATQTVTVNSRHRDNQDIVEDLFKIYLVLLDFRKFTEGRWLTEGKSSHGVVGSLWCGLEPLVEQARAPGSGTSEWYIHNYECLQDMHTRLYLVAATQLTWVVEGFMSEVLADDRMVRQAPLLLDVLSDELSYLHGLPFLVWERLASLVPGACAPTQLRSEVLAGSMVAAAYIRGQAIQPWLERPFTLARGSIRDNIDATVREPESEDPISHSIQMLMQVHWPVPKIEAGVRLFFEIRGSNNVTECGHEDAQILHREHRRYGNRMLQLRSMILAFRPLFTPDAVARQLYKMELKIQNLGRKTPGEISGRHLFFRDLMLEALAARPAGHALTQEEKTEVMIQHMDRWWGLDDQTRREYDQEARVEKAANVDRAREELLGARDALALARHNYEKDIADKGDLMCLSGCKLNDEDLARLTTHYNDPKWTEARVSGIRSKAVSPPLPPTMDERRELMSYKVFRERPDVPEWSKDVARHRAFFQNFALHVTLPGRTAEPGSEFWFGFLYAYQSPLYTVWLPLRREEPVMVPLRARNAVGGLRQLDQEDDWDFEFTYDVGKSCYDHDMHFPAASVFEVLPLLSYRPPARAVSNCMLLRLGDFLHGLPEMNDHAGVGNTGHSTLVDDAGDGWMERHPWMRRYTDPGDDDFFYFHRGRRDREVLEAWRLLNTYAIGVPFCIRHFTSKYIIILAMVNFHVW